MRKMLTEEYFSILEDSVGDYITIETAVGSFRTGKITGLSHKEMVFNYKNVDKKVEVIIEVEINGDPTDRIDLRDIVKMEIS